MWRTLIAYVNVVIIYLFFTSLIICVYNILSSLSFLECYKCPKLNIRLHILYVLDGFLFAIFCVL